MFLTRATAPTVGIFDSGVDYNHPALVTRFLYNVHADGLDSDGNGKADDFVGWGTSMSTPYVVNIAAKMLALAPALSPKQTKAIVMTTSQGVIDGPRAMRAAWLWQRVEAGASANAAASELGLSAAETARLVAVVAAVPAI